MDEERECMTCKYRDSYKHDLLCPGAFVLSLTEENKDKKCPHWEKN